MPERVYMPQDRRMGGGVAFQVTWKSIEEFLRGRRPYHPDLKENEVCDFVVHETGITVYVKDANPGPR